MKLFLDSSALAKRYIEENGSEVVRAKCHEAAAILISAITCPEVLSGLNRLTRERKISSANYQKLKNQLIEDQIHATIIGVHDDVILETIKCLEAASIRTLDAIQLASAIVAGCDLFLSADSRQYDAAMVLGLTAFFIK